MRSHVPSSGIRTILRVLAVLAVLLMCAPAWANFTRVQTKANFSGTAGDHAVRIGPAQGWAASTAGNALVVTCASQSSTAPPVISDDKSSKYTLITSSVYAEAPAMLAIYILPNNPGGVASITCTPSAFTTITIVAIELNGVASANAADQFSSNVNAFSAPNSWTSSATAAQAASGNYALGVAYEFYLGNQKFTAGGGWTSVITDSSGGVFVEEQNPVSDTRPIVATGNLSTTTDARVIAVAVTLRAAAAGAAK